MAFCPNCGKEVSDAAVSCPNCGHPLKQPLPPTKPNERISLLWWLLPLFLGLFGGLIGYFVLKDRNSSTATQILIFGIVWTFLGFVGIIGIIGFFFGGVGIFLGLIVAIFILGFIFRFTGAFGPR